MGARSKMRATVSMFPRAKGAWSIRARLSAVFLLMMAAVIVVGVGSLQSLQSVNDGEAAIHIRWLPSTHALGDLNNYTTDVPPVVTARARAETAGERASLDKQLLHLEQQIVAARSAYGRVSHDAVEDELYRRFAIDWGTYLTLVSQSLEAPVEFDGAGAQLRQLNQAYGSASIALGLLTDLNARGERRASEQSDVTYSQARKRIVAMIVFAAMLVATAMVFVTRSVSMPLKGLAQRMRGLITHQTSAPIHGIERRDEIGDMARAVLVFRDNAIDLAHSREVLASQTAVLEEKLVEEQRLTRVQRNFVSMASHEFGTPLAIIENHAQRLEALRERISASDLMERAHKIRSAVKRMLHLISNLIGSARLLDGRIGLAFHPEQIDLGTIVRECCELQRELASSAHIENHTATKSSMEIFGDPNLLTQAIGNLLSNAVKYSAAGTLITVKVTFGEMYASVFIEDGGIGVPERDRAHLFESYYRGSNTSKVVGSGVGLYLVKAIATVHLGSVTFEPIAAGGSRFILQIPIRPLCSVLN